MNLVEAVLFGVAVVVALTVLWIWQFQRERQLRAMQSQRIMKSLREAVILENSTGNIGVFEKPSILSPDARGVQPGHKTELSLVLYSHRQS
jgi:hypothetical protein